MRRSSGTLRRRTSGWLLAVGGFAATPAEILQTNESRAPRWLNVAPLPNDVTDAFVADLADLGKSTVVDSIAYSCTLVPEGDPAVDKAAIYAARFRAVRNRLRAVSPVKQGILFQATMGHGWKPNSKTPWQKVIGGEHGAPPDNPAYKFCPLGEEFLAYIARAAKTLAAERPDFFMVDDDTRLITFVDGCYCPRHLAEFARRTGKARTREEIIADCKADPALAAEWDRLRCDSIAVLLKTIRDQFPAETPGLFCCCRFDAHHAGRLARVLAAPGQRPLPQRPRRHGRDGCGEARGASGLHQRLLVSR